MRIPAPIIVKLISIFWIYREIKRTGPLLIRGRNLHDLALRGGWCYEQALSVCYQKWDKDRMVPKLSGDSIDDIIGFIQVEIYKLLVKKLKKFLLDPTIIQRLTIF